MPLTISLYYMIQLVIPASVTKVFFQVLHILYFTLSIFFLLPLIQYPAHMALVA